MRTKWWRAVTGSALIAGSMVWAATSPGGIAPAAAASSSAAQILNLHTVPEDLDVRGMIAFNSKVYFVADDDKYGTELWETDGTVSGTKLVKDIATGFEYGNPKSSDPSDLTVVGSKLYFSANDGVHGTELWATDGTTTAMVKDILPGSEGGYPLGSSPSRLTNLDGTLIFMAFDATAGYEPWKSDGTEAGTVLIGDLAPGSDSSVYSDDFAVVGSTAYFMGKSGDSDFELWKLTTSGGSVAVDINPGPGGSSPGNITAIGDSVYFTAIPGSYPTQNKVYRYDGTNLVDLTAGGLYYAYEFIALDSDTVLFSGLDSTNYTELWTTDGTAGSATLVKDICTQTNAGSEPEHFVKMGTKVYFIATDCVNGPALWESDGTSAGTKLLKDIVATGSEANYYTPNIAYITVIGSTMYFRASAYGISPYDDDYFDDRSELWKSDGTTAGTVEVKDINTGVDDYYGSGPLPQGSRISIGDYGPQTFPLLGSDFVFRACDDTTCGLWKSDGTSAGTVLIANSNPVDRGSYPNFRGSANDKAFFTAGGDSGYGLYVTDGTAGGTTKLRDGYIDESVVLNGKLIFVGRDDTAGSELWISDGTIAGTALLKDVYPGVDDNSNPRDSNAQGLTVAGPYMYFSANSAEGRELWRTDGTAIGTIRLTDIPGESYGYPNGVQAQYLTAVGSQLYFAGTTAATGYELWKSNGTVEGTTLVKDINAGDYYGEGAGTASSSPWGFVKIGTTVLFTAETDTEGRELWKTDGTAAGTVLVKEIRTGEQYGRPASAFESYLSPAVLGGKAYFGANDGTPGAQLWVSDGTTAGTYKVKQVSTYEYSRADPIIAFKGRLYFNVRESNPVERLWSSDGTEAGTGPFKDVVPNYYNWRVAGDTLYFTANDDEYHSQVWSTDGTVAGTKQVTTGLNDVNDPLPFRGGLLFSANNGDNGAEFWGVGLPVGTPQTISFSPPTDMKANETLALTATATSSLPVTFTAVGDCLIKTAGKNAGKLKLEGRGFCLVTASQAGDGTWARADDVEVGIVISKNSVTVAFVRVIPAPRPKGISVLESSRFVQLEAQVTPALEGCVVQFSVSPDSGSPAGPYVGVSDEDGIVLTPPLDLPLGTYDFTITPLGDCEGSPAQTPAVYVGELPATGSNTTGTLWAAVLSCALGALLVSGASISGRRRRSA